MKKTIDTIDTMSWRKVKLEDLLTGNKIILENISITLLFIFCKTKSEEVVDYDMGHKMLPTHVSQRTTALPNKKLPQNKLHKLY